MSITLDVNLSNLPPNEERQREEVQDTSPLMRLVSGILAKKTAAKEEALGSVWDRYNPIFIGGDFFTMGYLAFEGAQGVMPTLAVCSGVVMATMVCGVIGGVINLGVGIQSLKYAIDALRRGDYILAPRLFLDFLGLTGIGIVMILASLGMKVSLLAAVGGILSNPWILPVLFFIITIPTIIEVCYRIGPIVSKKDPGAKLKLAEMKALLYDCEAIDVAKLIKPFQIDEGTAATLKTYLSQIKASQQKIKKYETDSRDVSLQKKIRAEVKEETQILAQLEGAMQELLRKNPQQIYAESFSQEELMQVMCAQIENLQTEMGVTVSVEMFGLVDVLLSQDRTKIEEQIQKLEKEIAGWNRAQTVRLVQQILYLVAFVVSMFVLIPYAPSNAMDVGNNFAMALANAIPLWMDSFWPFERNAPIIVPKVDMQFTTS